MYNRQIKNRKTKVIVFGDVIRDRYLCGSVSRISPEAPVPVVAINQEVSRLGGAGNVANNLIGLGMQVELLTCIGTDADGDWIIDDLKQKGISSQWVFRDKNVQTICKSRIVSQNQQILRIDQEKIAEPTGDFLEMLQANTTKYLLGVSAVIISDYGKGLINEETAQVVIKAARLNDIPVIIDPKGDNYKKYNGCTLCTPNFKEFKQAIQYAGNEITEEKILQEGIRLCKENGLENLLITRSEQGMSLILPQCGEKTDFPVQTREVVDVTGAGDTVIATFAAGLCWGMSYEECCVLANVAASVVIQHFGTFRISLSDLEKAIESTSKGKIISREEASSIAEELHQANKKIVFTNGCFDLLHAGHITSLSNAKKKGDYLFVGLNSDASVRRLKGESRPVVDQDNRAKMLEAISCVDYIIIFDEDTPQDLIERIYPDVLIKGADWRGKYVAGQECVLSRGGEIVFEDLGPNISTTEIIRRIKGTK